MFVAAPHGDRLLDELLLPLRHLAGGGDKMIALGMCGS